MARGRKKDHTIPATRSLTLQRDYRARRAQYIADLEARCTAAEADNVRLRKELEIARRAPAVALQSGPSPDMLRASAELRDTLAAAAASLSQFLRHAGSDPTTSGEFSTPVVYVDPKLGVQEPSVAEKDRHTRPESPCCGGYIDCDQLEEDNVLEPEQPESSAMAMVSQLRSTSDTL
ncbi:hypothetical protein C8J57DRAFT_1505700 [Mycena rebaudengoi]|nr:hypothetical protein C8J57DRAFT_1505700 [Mycena rebaudengoi]